MTHVPYNKETALIVFQGLAENVFGVQTPFRGFLDALYDIMVHPEAHTNRGAVIWQGYPMGMIVGYGLLPVLQKVAQKHGFPFSSVADQSQVMVAVDPFLQSGLVLRYASMQEAAQDFLRRVIKATDQFLSLGWRPGINLSASAYTEWNTTGRSDQARREIALQIHRPRKETIVAGLLWQLPSALFFRDLLAATQSKTQEVRQSVQTLSARDRTIFCLGHRLPLTYRSVDHLWNDVTFLELDFSRSPHTKLSNESEWRQFFQKIEEELDGFDHWLQLLDVLPLRSSRIARHALEIVEDGSILRGPEAFAEAWVATQTMLALLDRPLDSITSVRIQEYIEALHLLGREEPSKVLSRVMTRLCRLAPKLSTVSIQFLERYVSKLLVEMTTWSTQAEIDIQTRAFVDALYGEIAITPHEAEDYATGEDLALRMQLPRRVKDREVMVAKIVEMISWADLDAETIRKMTEVGVLSPITIAKGLAQIPEETRGSCLEAFLHAVIMDEEILRVLLDERVMPLNGKLVKRFFPHLSKKDLFVWLRDHMRDEVVWERGDGMISTVLQALMRLETEQVQTLLDAPPLRAWWSSHIFSELFSSSEFERLHISLLAWRRWVKEVMEEDCWIRHMLALSVLDREKAYRAETITDKDAYRVCWDQLHNSPLGDYDWPFIFDRKEEDLAELFERYPEEDILAWLHADESAEAFAKRLTQYEKDRADYYRRFGTTPPTFDNE